MKKNSKIILILAIAVVVVVGGINLYPLLFNEPAAVSQTSGSAISQDEYEQPVDISIVCVGDVMAHLTQIKAQYDSASGAYSFDNNFQYIKPYIENADLAICNVETTFAGEPYAGYPAFSCPDELAAAVANAGFDVASTANNHMLDRGTAGLYRTLDVLQKNGLKTTGSIENTSDKRYALTEVEGIRIAVIAYTYENSPNETDVSINGNVISADTAAHINSFNYKKIDSELAKIAETVQQAKDDGAKIVIMYYHWGEEYQLEANQWQKYMAEQTVKTMPVDIIFASHPHVLQPATWVTDEADGMSVPVFYSLGNCISNQRRETLDNRYTEQGAIGQVNIEYNKNLDKIENMTMTATPTWVEKYELGGKTIYAVVPLDDGLQQNADIAASGHLSRAQSAWEEANGILGIN